MDSSAVLNDLVELSRQVGRPENDLVILAEGNTSARCGDRFWVKASGKRLHEIHVGGFVEVSLQPVLDLFDQQLEDAAVKQALQAARVDPDQPLMPSIETFMHADLLSLPEVEVVIHTHPTILNGLLTVQGAEEWASWRLFPDEVVLCGPATCWVPYADPGMPLSRAIRTSVRQFIAERGEVPKVLWLANHGLITLGRNGPEAWSATWMAVKAARILAGALATGRPPARLTDEEIDRIHTRPDEHYRQRLLWETQSNIFTPST